ncbi:nucleotidyltransferase family protein [Microcella sp.]|uniref:nucleotidyltransferase family protein n=1 Tax=Microcella sp. TaxID=1913979 RepID=UPI003F70E949
MTSTGTVTTVAVARYDLSRTLRRFRTGDLEPVVLGSHRKPEAVIVPYATFRAVETVAPVLTLDALRQRRRLIMRLAALANLDRVLVTGSVARGDATPDSDLDLIVDPQPGASLLDLAQFADDLEQLLGRPVDVLSARSLDPVTDAALLADAVPL